MMDVWNYWMHQILWMHLSVSWKMELFHAIAGDKLYKIWVRTWIDLKSYRSLEDTLLLDPYQLWVNAFYLLLWQPQHVVWWHHKLLFRQWYYSIGWPRILLKNWSIKYRCLTCCRRRPPLNDSKVAELRVMKKQLNLRSGSFGVGIGTHLLGSLQLQDDVQRQFAPVPYLSSKFRRLLVDRDPIIEYWWK